MIYLYGLAEATTANMAHALEDKTGLQAPLEVTQAGPWLLVHSEQDDAEILPKRRLMLAHTRVLEAMLTAGAILPARFGLVARTMQETQDLITAQSRLISAEFDRIRGCVELGIRVQFPRDAALAATLAENSNLTAERDKLRQRGAEAHYAIAEFGGKVADQLDRRRGAAQRQMLETLKPFIKDHVLRAPEEDTEVLRAEVLVDQDRQLDLESAIEEVAKGLEFAAGADPIIQMIGPAPVYNFVRLNLSPDPEEAAA